MREVVHKGPRYLERESIEGRRQMNKKTLRIAGWALGLSVAVAGIGAVAGMSAEVPNETTASAGDIITNHANIISGKYYYIRAKVSNNPVDYWVATGGTETGNGLSRNNITTNRDSATKVLFTGSGTSWKMQFDNGNYLYLRNNESNGYYSVSETAQTWTASTNNNLITFSINGKNLLRNSTYATKYFGSYGSGTAVTLEECPATKTLESIAVTNAPTKTTYYVGDSFDASGMVVTATYNDASTNNVTSGCTFIPDTFSSTGVQNVTVSYTENEVTKETTQSVTVNAARSVTSIEVSSAPAKTVYREGETFDPTGLVITRNYNAGDPDTYTYADHEDEFTFSPSLETALQKNNTSVSITYAGQTTSQAITVNEVERFEKIDSVEGLVSGSRYIIGDASGAKFLSSTQNSNNRSAVALEGEIDNDVVTFEDGMEILTLGGSAGQWTLYANNSDPKGYLYAASNSSNYLRTQTENNANGQWAIAFDNNGIPTLTAQGTNSHNVLKNNGNLFSCYESGQTDVSLWKVVDTSESVTLTSNNVSGMKGNDDHSISVIANNFDATSIEVTYSTANIASVTGTVNDGNIDLDVDFLKVGTTTATITVKGGEKDYEATLDITVVQKPKTLSLVNGYISNNTIEVKRGGSRQISFAATDTDDGAYAIDYGGIDATSSNQSIVRLTGTSNMVLNGDAVGQATVTCTMKATAGWATPISQTLTVNVIEDYNDCDATITFNDDLTATQGNALSINDVIATKTATTHFGTNNSIISDEELLFSYDEDDFAGAVPASSFIYDFTHGSVVDATHKSQRIYVYVTFDEDYSTYFDIQVEQANVPLTGLTITNAVNDEIDVVRGGSVQLEVSYDPSNTTDDRSLTYTVTDGVAGHSISVNSTGLVSVGSNVGKSATVRVASTEKPSVYAEVTINNVLEEMTITAHESAVYSKISDAKDLTTGDYLIVYEDGGLAFDGSLATLDAADNVVAVEISDGTIASTDAINSAVFHYDASTDTLLSSSGYYIGQTSDANGLASSESTTYGNTISFSDGNANIVSGGAYLRYNSASNQNRFRYYKSGSYTGQKAVQLYKKSGGDSIETVEVDLIQAIETFYSAENFSCDDSGASFNLSAWNNHSAFSAALITKYNLATVVADKDGNEVEQFLAKYDYVIGVKKALALPGWNEADDFLGRFAVGGINYGSNVVQGPSYGVAANSDNTVAIASIAVTGFVAVGGVLLLVRKRRNEE